MLILKTKIKLAGINFGGSKITLNLEEINFSGLQVIFGGHFANPPKQVPTKISSLEVVCKGEGKHFRCKDAYIKKL